MLVLTQLGVGAFSVLSLIGGLPLHNHSRAQSSLAWMGVIGTVLGLLGSTLHLGRPMKAWRSFLGWRKSWLSREILLFGAFLPLALMTAALASLSVFSPAAFGVSRLQLLASATALVGLAGVLCSGMVYHDTKRAFWNGLRSVGRFFATTAVLGLGAGWLCVSAGGGKIAWIPAALSMAATIKLACENRLFQRASSDLAEEAWPKHASFDHWSLAQSAVLMRDKLGLLTRARFFFGIVSGVVLPLLSLLPEMPEFALACVAFGANLAGEFAERYLFFRCVVPPRMPGGEAAYA
jgi:DMSO reductase anchor subunit